MTWDGNAPSPNVPLSRQMVPAGDTWMCVLNVAARQRGAAASTMWSFAFCVQNNAGTTGLVGTVRNLITPDASPTWACAVAADAANNTFRVTCTGAAGATIDWLGSVDVLKVAA
jgi:hypothetical protein